jgi:hypothetical protein
MDYRPNDLLTTIEVARLKAVDPSSVRRALLRGRLHGERKGRDWVIRYREAAAWEPERRGPKRAAKSAEESA